MSEVTRILSAVEQGDLHAAGQLLGGARHQVRRFLWLFGRVWTEALLLPLRAVCRPSARWRLRLACGGGLCRSAQAQLRGHPISAKALVILECEEAFENPELFPLDGPAQQPQGLRSLHPWESLYAPAVC